MGIELREYQLDAIDALRQNLRKGVLRQILCMATGSGKTVVALQMIRLCLEKNPDARVYFIADRQTLVNQTSERFWEGGLDHGVLMGNDSRRLWENVIVCSAQTLESRGFGFPRFDGSAEYPDLVIMDEVHEIRKKLVKEVKEQNIPTIGLTATPFTRGLGEWWEEIVNCTTTQALVNTKFLSPLKVVAAVAEVDVNGLTVSSTGEWVKKEMSAQVLQVTGDCVKEWVKNTDQYFGGPQPTIAFCPTVADSADLAEKFQNAGYDFRVVHYKQSAAQKQQMIDDFKAGRHIGLVSCVALCKGFDAPATRVLIDAYPLRKSFATHIQRIGRVMRICSGKEFGLIIDHSGNWLGFYDETHAFFESGANNSYLQEKKQEVRKPREKTQHLRCKQCGYVYPPDYREETCPACGAARRRPRGKMLHVDGTLAEVDEITGKKRKMGFEGDWWPELCKNALRVCSGDAERARKMALAQYRQIFGTWPKDDFIVDENPPVEAVVKYTHKLYRRWKAKQRRTG